MRTPFLLLGALLLGAVVVLGHPPVSDPWVSRAPADVVVTDEELDAYRPDQRPMHTTALMAGASANARARARARREESGF